MEESVIPLATYLQYCSTELPFPGLLFFRQQFLNSKVYKWVADLTFNSDNSITIDLDTGIPDNPRIHYNCACSPEIYQAYKQQTPLQADRKNKYVIVCRPVADFPTCSINYQLLHPRERATDNLPFPKFAVQFYSFKPQDMQRCSQELSV